MIQQGMMALAPSKYTVVQCCLSSERLLVRQHIPTTLSLPLSRKPLSWSVLLSSWARNFSSTIAAASSSSKKKKKQNLSHNHIKEGEEEEEEEEEEEDAFELLFKQLEEDLKNDDMSFDVDDDDDDEITEEDLAIFERELEDALRGDAEMLQSVIDDTEKFKSAINDTEADKDPVDEEKDDDGSGKSLKLRNWQLRKLAKALKDGRRKTRIKSLAADVCLDRAVVLELLRDPPPNLLMMSLALPDDEPTVTVELPETKSTETVQEETSLVPAKPESKAIVPVHVMQHRWAAQKRLKKVHVETLERVYKKTKRPTNTMISSIVHVTNLPRRRIVQWFEEKRAEEGVPDHRSPYHRSVSESV